MLFKMFNLKEEIDNYNKKYKTNYHENESFEFHYFISDNLEKANHYLDLINHGNEAFILSSEGGKFVKELNTASRRIKIDFSRSKNIKRFNGGAIFNATPYTPEEVKFYEEENRKNAQWFETIKKQAKNLSDETFWAINHKINNIDQIKNLWLKNSVLASFNDTAIYKIASETLPLLVAYHQEAFEELQNHKHSIPDEIYKAYLNYLKDFKERAHKMQRLLIDSMLTRLSAYDKSKGAYSNPIIYIQDLIRPSFERPFQPVVLKPKEFDFFHQYIRLHGNQEQKKELLQRSWYTSVNNIPTKVIKTSDGNCLLVPEKLAKDIPTKSRWPKWLFWAQNIRHTLFKENVSSIAILKGRIEINKLLIDLKLPEPYIIAFKEINNREQHIIESLINVESYYTKHTFLAWLSPTTNGFLDNWRNILMEQQRIVLDDKVELAKRLVESFKSELLNKKLTENIPWSSIEVLLKLKKDLERLIETDKTLEGRTYQIQTLIIQINRLTDCQKMLSLASDNINLNEEELNKILKYLSNIQNEDKEIYDGFIEQTKPLFHKIKANLIYEIQINPFACDSTKERNRHHSIITISTALLDKVSNLNENKELDDFIIKYFLNFLQHITTDNNIQNFAYNVRLNDNIKLADNVLSIISSLATWQNKPLSYYLEDLQKEKLKSNRLFIAKCNNLIKQITLYFNEKELNQDLNMLDDELVKLLKAPPYSYTDRVIYRIFCIRDALASGTTLESMKLTLSDEKLLGISNTGREHIWALISQSIQAKQVQLSLNNYQLSNNNKINEIESLRKSFSNFLKGTIPLPDSIRVNQLFNKSNFTTPLTQPEKSLPTIQL